MENMICKLCKNTITKSDHYYSQSDSYEAAEAGHEYGCFFFLWDFETLGDSNLYEFKEVIDKTKYVQSPEEEFEGKKIRWEKKEWSMN